MKSKKTISKIIALLASLFFALNIYLIIQMLLSGTSPFPGYDYSFPVTQIARISASAITMVFVLGYLFEPNFLTDKISDFSKIDFGNNVHGALYIALCGAFWLIFGSSLTSGIQAFEIRFILGETVSFSGISELSIILNQIILFIPFVVVPVTYIGAVDSRKVTNVLNLKKENILYNLFIGVLVGVIILLTVGSINYVISVLFELETENLALNQIAQLGPFFALFISLSAGITEEIFFRGFLQKKIGLISASFLFAITHAGYGILIQITGPFVFGLIIGYVYNKTDNLITPITAHTSMNLIVLLITIYNPLA